MPPKKPNYHTVKSKGHIFVFKYDDKAPELLHIYVRRMMTESGAIEIFFTGTTVWDEFHQLYETTAGNDGLSWFWIDEEKKVVMIVSAH